jgi:predicted helicase
MTEKDSSTVLYKHKISVSGVPFAACEYVVNGKSAINWVMECPRVKIDKDSGILESAA